MRVLMLAPWKAAIIQRLIVALKHEGVEIFLASHDAAGQNDIFNFGTLNTFIDFLRPIKLNEIIKQTKPDLIHAHYATHYGILAAMQKRVPFVLALWGSDVMYDAANTDKLKGAILKLFLKYSVKRAVICHSSSSHVCETAGKIAGIVNESKFQNWYWGIIPDQLIKKPLKEEVAGLLSEYNIPESIILSGRGLAKIYRPSEIAEIVRRCSQILSSKNIRFVILRGTASNEEVVEFKRSIEGLENACIFVDRLLNEKELAHLYHSSIAHISIPLSDSLGGGVVEPALCGSYPILSDLQGNRWFAENYGGAILPKESKLIVDQAIKIIYERLYSENLQNQMAYQKIIKDFSSRQVVQKIVSLYSDALKLSISKLHVR